MHTDYIIWTTFYCMNYIFSPFNYIVTFTCWITCAKLRFWVVYKLYWANCRRKGFIWFVIIAILHCLGRRREKKQAAARKASVQPGGPDETPEVPASPENSDENREA